MRLAMRVRLLLLCSVVSCAGGGSDPETISGTVATGAPVPGATVTFKDSTGEAVSTTTNGAGHYSVDVTGMTGPFIGQVQLPTGGELFSIATETGTANIDLFTNIATDAFFAVRNTTPETVFPTIDDTTPLPNPVEFQSLQGIVERTIQPWLAATGVDPAGFELVTTPYAADGTGYDQVLEYTTIIPGDLLVAQIQGTVSIEVATIQITDGVTSQTSTFSADVTGNLAMDTTTTGPGGTSSSYDATTIPPTAAAAAAELGVAATLEQFRDTINSKGASLTASDLLPFTTTDLLDGGRDRTVFTAEVATELRGVTLGEIEIHRILGYDEANEILHVELRLTATEGSQTESDTPEVSFKKVGSAYLMYGNQMPIDLEDAVQFETRTDSFSTGTTTNTSINIDVEAPTGTVNTITVSGPGGFSNTSVNKDAQTRTDVLEPTPSTTLNYVKDAFFVNSGAITLPTPPATYTFTVDGSAMYSRTVNGQGGEAISFSVSPNTYSKAAVKGQTITVSWSLPTTHAVERIHLSASMSDGSTTVFVEKDIDPLATSGQLTFVPPTGTPNPSTFNPVNFNLSFDGPNGERSQVNYTFDLP